VIARAAGRIVARRARTALAHRARTELAHRAPFAASAAALLLVVLAAGAGALAAQPTQTATPVPSIVMGGDATIARAPDVAFLTVAVETRARTPNDAQRQNADAMAGVERQIAAAGIRKDALRTIGLWLEQEFDMQNGRRVPRGYVARNSVEIRIDEVARAGEIADQVVQGGATSISQLRFDLRDRAGAEREALQMAVVDARRRADAAAAAAGTTVDRVIRIEDTRAELVEPRQFMIRADAAGAPTPVAPGTIEIRAHVVMTVSMR
jgi:uncharacterized protein